MALSLCEGEQPVDRDEHSDLRVARVTDTIGTTNKGLERNVGDEFPQRAL